MLLFNVIVFHLV